jgi:adenylosuccinate synthase
MPLDIIVGAQWGDEGKGRVVDLLSSEADYVARFSGGDNAGHTVTVGDQTYKLHLVPSGIVHPHTVGILGNGMVINPETLLAEIEQNRRSGVESTPDGLRIAFGAHLITPVHKALDQAQEKARGKEAIGTTLRGIGPAYMAKVGRYGVQAGEMLDLEGFAEAIKTHVEIGNQQLVELYGAEPLDPDAIALQFAVYSTELTPYIGDVSTLLTQALRAGQTVLAEGAQGTLLDLDHGTYPYVTSSNPTAPAALTGLGLGISHIGRVIGVTKAFQTRVGEGPFPTEVQGEIADRLRGTGENPWDEFGTTTGRPRRVGWLDLVLLRYAVRVNGLSELALTKLDVLTGIETLQICTEYEIDGKRISDLPLGPGDLSPFKPIYQEVPGWSEEVQEMRSWNELPEAACEYILQIEDEIGVPIRTISVGPEREQVIRIGG